jgi:hypothetical protein
MKMMGGCHPTRTTLSNLGHGHLALIAMILATIGTAGAHAQGDDREAIMAKVYAANFSGLKLGMPLKQALDTLAAQGYSDVRGTGISHIYRTFRYGIACPKDQNVAICQVYGNHDFIMEMEFKKRDAGGNEYRVIVDFTRFYMASSASPLQHARVKRINGFIKIKGPMEDSDYQKLADEKYGENHNVAANRHVEGMYDGNPHIENDWNGNKVCDCLNTAAVNNQLAVTIDDEDMQDDIDNNQLNEDVARRRRAVQKPVF